MTVSINGSSGIVFNDASTQNTSPFTGGFAFRNRLINGSMVIDQRNAGASVTPANGGYTLDRWFFTLSQASKVTTQQNAGSVTPPEGFTNYLGVTSSSAYSVLTGDTFLVAQKIEGFNTADLGWGTANAKTVTLSFWVRSSLTGTFGGVLGNSDGTRSYPFSYSVPTANTWTQISVTIAGDTSGTWLTNSSVGVLLRFGLGSGATYSGTAGAWASANLVQPTGTVSVVGTNGATFYITGVQLEKGSTATSFDYRPYGTELALCQRYYQKLGLAANAAIGAGLSTTSSQGLACIRFMVPMRAAPTAGYSALGFTDNVNYTGNVSSLVQLDAGLDGARLFVGTNAVMTALRAGTLNSQSSSGYLDLTAEL